MNAEERALRRLRVGTGSFGIKWENDLPDDAVRRSMEYKWTLLHEQLRDFGRLLMSKLPKKTG